MIRRRLGRDKRSRGDKPAPDQSVLWIIASSFLGDPDFVHGVRWSLGFRNIENSIFIRTEMSC